MKNSILLSFFLSISNILFAQNTMSEYITTIEKDTLYWEYIDTVCFLKLHKLDNTQEKIIGFVEPKPSRKIQSIKFEDNLCGILTNDPFDTTYFLVNKKEGTWKIIKFFSWNHFGVTDDHPDNILSITLNSARQITVVKKDNETETISLNTSGKATTAIKKE